jgi:hypothetical protein
MWAHTCPEHGCGASGDSGGRAHGPGPARPTLSVYGLGIIRMRPQWIGNHYLVWDIRNLTIRLGNQITFEFIAGDIHLRHARCFVVRLVFCNLDSDSLS